MWCYFFRVQMEGDGESIMNFLNHQWLWALLLLLPAAMLAVWYGARRKRKLLLDYLSGGATLILSPGRRLLRVLLLLTAILFLALSAARPWWGEHLLDIPIAGRDVLVVFDVSKSMLAQDVAPSRLEHAKWLLRELIRLNPADRFGIIAFAGRAFFSCPLTSDRVSLEQCVAELNTELVPVGGTNLAQALQTAVVALKAAAGQDKCIILMTDGEELTGSVQGLLAELKKAKIELLTVGLGDPSVPALIPEAGPNGETFKRDAQGELVRTRLNENLLKELTAATGGVYCNSTAGNTGLELINRRLQELETAGVRERKRTLPIDRFMIFLVAGMGALTLWFLIGETPSRRGGKAAVLILWLGLAPFSGYAEDNGRLEKHPEAEGSPVPEQNALPSDPIQLYNQARELQLAGKFDEARKLYEEALAHGARNAAHAVSMHNLGIMSHQQSRQTAAQARQTAQSGDLDGALREAAKAEKGLDQAENWYVDTLSSGADEVKNGTEHHTALAQQMLLKDREQLEQLKKMLEDLKKKQQEARRKTRQAQQQNRQQQEQQQSQGQQNQQNQQEQQNQQQQPQDQQGQQSQQQQSQGQQSQQQQSQGQKNQQNRQQQSQGQQNQQEQQQSQDQQSGQGQQSQQNQQQQPQDQQGQQSQQQQSQGQQSQQQQSQGQKNQQNRQQQSQGQQNQQEQQQSQDQQSGQGQQNQQNRQQQSQDQQNRQSQAQRSLQEARDAVDDLQKSADKLGQNPLREQARKAKEELDKAARKQQNQDYAGAQKHLDEAMRDLGRPDDGKSEKNDGKNQSGSATDGQKSDAGENSRSDGNSEKGESAGDQSNPEKGEAGKEGAQPEPGDPGKEDGKEADAPLPVQPEAGEQSEQKMDEKQTDALLDLMSQDEKLLRDAIKQHRNRRIRPVEKDW